MLFSGPRTIRTRLVDQEKGKPGNADVRPYGALYCNAGTRINIHVPTPAPRISRTSAFANRLDGIQIKGSARAATWKNPPCRFNPQVRSFTDSGFAT